MPYQRQSLALGEVNLISLQAGTYQEGADSRARTLGKRQGPKHRFFTAVEATHGQQKIIIMKEDEDQKGHRDCRLRAIPTCTPRPAGTFHRQHNSFWEFLLGRTHHLSYRFRHIENVKAIIRENVEAIIREKPRAVWTYRCMCRDDSGTAIAAQNLHPVYVRENEMQDSYLHCNLPRGPSRDSERFPDATRPNKL
ncbi:hypothetical protein VTN77DRAFT_6957 [Rasamsonia byssochlamydoides]|uniref:uncharacterized protein n=1 Tax=Rasamsonia byssochlamydoides TaxID=89139 RepID=UPI0037433A4C